MHHKLIRIAETHKFNVQRFFDFVLANIQKYGIVTQWQSDGKWIDAPKGYWSVSTWYVDDLVKAYKEHIGEA